MKINYKLLKDIEMKGLEPFETQEIDGRVLKLYYLNETSHYATNISQGRFYVWASDGVNYALVIERGFHDKVKYFFTKEINAAWLEFLLNASQTRAKSMPISMLLSFLPILLAVVGFVLLPDSFKTWIIIGGFAVSLIGSMTYTSKLNTKIHNFNRDTHIKIQELLTPEVFSKFFDDQKEYSEQFFKENFGEEVEEDNLLVESEEVLTEEVVTEVLEDVVEVDKTTNLEAMTVAELKDLAKEMKLTGYTTFKKAELINFIKENL